MVATLLDKNGIVWVYGDGDRCNGVYDDHRSVYVIKTKLNIDIKIVKCSSNDINHLMLDEEGNVWGFGMNYRGCFPTDEMGVKIATKFWIDGGIVDVCQGLSVSVLLDVCGFVWICSKDFGCDIFTKVANIPIINKIVAHARCVYMRDYNYRWWFLGRSPMNDSVSYTTAIRLDIDFNVADIGINGSDHILMIDDYQNIYGCGLNCDKQICKSGVEVYTKPKHIGNFKASKIITVGLSSYILDIEGNVWFYCTLINIDHEKDLVGEWIKINTVPMIDMSAFEGTFIVMIDKKGHGWIHGSIRSDIISTATKIYMYKNLGAFSLEYSNIKSARNI